VTEADRGVAIRFVGHATVLVELDGVRILTDPFLRDRLGPLERHGPTPEAAELGPVDVVLVSHGHPDHLDRRSLEAIKGNPTVVVPRRLGPMVRRWLGCEVVELRPGERRDVRGVPIEAVRAKHWIAPGAPRAQPLGYLVGDRTVVWFAGDTARYPEMIALRGRVDVGTASRAGPPWTRGRGRRRRGRGSTRRGPDPLGHPLSAAAAPALDGAARPAGRPFRCSCGAGRAFDGCPRSSTWRQHDRASFLAVDDGRWASDRARLRTRRQLR
jgi:hypothetical protein